MQIILKTIKKHPVSLLAYIAYLWLFISQLRVQLRFRAASSHIDDGDRLAWGEGVMYGWLLLIIVVIVFTLIAFLNAALNKGERWFYIRLSIAILLPAMLLCFLN